MHNSHALKFNQLAISIIFTCCFAFNSTKSLAETPLTIAVASNFKDCLQDISEAYKLYSGKDLRIISASSAKLFTQIQQGAPFDLFLSADSDKPARLSKLGLADKESLQTYATGQLMLWSNQEADAASLLLKANSIAMANPLFAPYGIAAKEVLTSYSAPQARILLGENIAQSFQFKFSGNAELAFIAASQADAINHGVIIKLDAQLYSNIEQQLVIIKKSKNVKQAKAFLHFLHSEQGQTIIQQHGYLLKGNNS